MCHFESVKIFAVMYLVLRLMRLQRLHILSWYRKQRLLAQVSRARLRSHGNDKPEYILTVCQWFYHLPMGRALLNQLSYHASMQPRLCHAVQKFCRLKIRPQIWRSNF